MGSRRPLGSEDRARIFKALADPHRVELIDTLARDGPQCGTELAERLGISIALLSHHWEVLCEAGLLEKTRVGQARYCSLDMKRLREATGCWDDACDAVPVTEVAAKKKPIRKQRKPRKV
jgi:ArsR family transcriptional regulator, arsenate/arsenite/antimonite-responsive transcriptional repressor